jgi:hypothetical protein
MTPVWQGALLVVFAVGAFFAWPEGVRAFRQVFTNTRMVACAALAVLETIRDCGRSNRQYDVRGDWDVAGSRGP